MLDEQTARIIKDVISAIDAVNGRDGDEFPSVRQKMLWEAADALRTLLPRAYTTDGRTHIGVPTLDDLREMLRARKEAGDE